MFEDNPYCNQDLLLSCLTSYPCCHRWLVLLLISWMGLATFFIVPKCVGFWIFKTTLYNTIQSSTIACLYVYVLFVKQVQLSQTFSEVWRKFYLKNTMRFYRFIDAMPTSSFCTQPNILYLIAIIECFQWMTCISALEASSPPRRWNIVLKIIGLYR